MARLLIDLGTAPPSNAYFDPGRASSSEKRYPLRVRVCASCWLVQTEDHVDARELFPDDYAYWSSCSSTWLEHARRYVAEMTGRFKLDASKFVVEVASNDGYLLQYVRQAGIPCLGIEPAKSAAGEAKRKGIEVVEEFFGAGLAARLAKERGRADLVTANNVLAHVPDINDFVSGFPALLKPEGVATFEFPHILRLISEGLFDTIYHEHYSYLSLTSVDRVFRTNGLAVFDVEELPTQGGSLRVFAQRADTAPFPVGGRVLDQRVSEERAGVSTLGYYAGFQERAERIKADLLRFLSDAKGRGKPVAGYGAAAKGSTLLNFAGVGPDLVSFVADANPVKQGKCLPGSRIPIVREAELRARRPDYVLIFPWNLKEEIMAQLSYVRDWGGRFVTAMPEMRVWE